MTGSDIGRAVAESMGLFLMIVIMISMVVGVVLWEGLCWLLGHPHLFR